MLAASAQLARFIQAQSQSPAMYVKVQLPTEDGLNAASQFVLSNVTSFQMSRNLEPSSDTASFVLTDNLGAYSSLNPYSKYGLAFHPGDIDKKFIIYLGFKGDQGARTSNFTPYTQSVLPVFTGYIVTDQQDLSPGGLVKTVNLIDLSNQFQGQIYDTFPHPIYGSQVLSYFDPNYNLYPINSNGTTATEWECDGKMFTKSNEDKLYGNTHINVAVYVDETGGLNPASAPTTLSWTFDYDNGIVTFATPIPTGSTVSIAGNPTYMAPEVMVRKILVEKCQWAPDFLQLDPTNVLLPMYSSDNNTAWYCLEQIASLTNPRFIPWVIHVDFNGVMHFEESPIDSPPDKTYVDEEDMITCEYVNTARQISTVVRADASVIVSQAGNPIDQPVSSIAYDINAINEYGLTQTLEIDSSLLINIQNLSPVQALSAMNALTASALAVSSRPIFTIQAQVRPDPTIEINDTARVRSKRTGIDTYMTVQGIDIAIDPKGGFNQTLRLQQYVETVNYVVGIPNGVTATGVASVATSVPPTNPIIGAIRMGNGVYQSYPYLNSQYNNNGTTGDPVVPIWNANLSDPMHFDVYLNSLAATATTYTGSPAYQFNYTHLPPGYAWTTQVNTAGQTVYYCQNDGDGYTLYVGPDSVFYRYKHAPGTSYLISASDMILANVWIPTGNDTSTAFGGPQAYTGNGSTVYLWMWWYLCLNSNFGEGKEFRLVQRVNTTLDGAAQTVGAENGLWINNLWSGYPGPNANSVYYENVVAGISNFTNPPTGFIGANLLGDGDLYGVAYGNAAPAGSYYVGYDKKTRGHLCILAANNAGQTQFCRVPFYVYL